MTITETKSQPRQARRRKCVDKLHLANLSTLLLMLGVKPRLQSKVKCPSDRPAFAIHRAPANVLYDFLEEARENHRKLIKELHPDKSGDCHKEAARVNVAWARVKELMKRRGIFAAIAMLGFICGCAATQPVQNKPAAIVPDINPAHYGNMASRQSADQPEQVELVIAPPPSAEIVIHIPPMPGVEHAYLLSKAGQFGPWIERSFDDIEVLSNGDWRVKPTPGVTLEFYKVVPCEDLP